MYRNRLTDSHLDNVLLGLEELKVFLNNKYCTNFEINVWLHLGFEFYLLNYYIMIIKKVKYG